MTTVARTWFDVARTHPLRDGLSVGDGGLRSGRLSGNDVLGVLARAGSVRGCRRAALAAIHLDGLRETALESGSWAYFVEHRLPLPRMQVEIRDECGHLIGRVDFLWESARLVGECDGRLKYEERESIYQEKRREDEIRAYGYGVLRWGWEDLWDGRLASRIRRAL
jgi:very-short-patch-repair endonuclease